jgi:hypothetical protein
LLTASATIAVLSGSSLASSTAHADDHHRDRDRVHSVLLLSFDGLHAADLEISGIIGIAKIGVIYTGGSKIAEHGGLNEDDTQVALVVSHPDFEPDTINAPVATTQIAPTILKVLGIDPTELEAVRLENTRVLPDFD